MQFPIVALFNAVSKSSHGSKFQFTRVSDSVNSMNKVSLVQFLIKKDLFESIIHELNIISIINTKTDSPIFIFIIKNFKY